MTLPARILVIGGLDPSGRAGLAADLRAAAWAGAYAAPIAAALTVQGEGPVESQAVDAGLLGRQLAASLRSQQVQAVKAGLLPGAAQVRALAEALRQAPGIPLVLDPVLAASQGGALVLPDLLPALRQGLLTRCNLLTPNVDEAGALLGRPLAPGRAAFEADARALLDLGAEAVLLKGGHLDGAESPDLLIQADGLTWLEGPRSSSPNTRGTGCSLATLIACGLAQGQPLLEACQAAKTALAGLLKQNQALHWPGGAGPVLPSA